MSGLTSLLRYFLFLGFSIFNLKIYSADRPLNFLTLVILIMICSLEEAFMNSQILNLVSISY